MGILTDPQQRRRFIQLISRYNNVLVGLCYVVGFVWFLALAYEPINASTYFSENALLPGLVEGHFHGGEEIKSYSEDLRRELQKNKRVTPKKWVYDKFREVGLDVYTQNFSIHYPLNLLPEGQTVDGQNVYAIMRAPRAASTEAIVISAPFRPLSNPDAKTHVGIAMMITLARYFYKQSYWAKDIIFVASDQEYAGMQAWLDAYHGTNKSPNIVADDLYGRAGSIQAALNLEIGTIALSHVNVNIEGLNGQLPNLDLFNMVTKLCRMEGLRPLLHRRSDHRQPESFPGYTSSLITMVTMMWHQATGSPSGNHGLFHQYNIEAVTLESVKRTGYSRDINSMGRVMDGCLRSLNNLMERFHQSFFFYLLPGTQRYVSIGLYMPPFAVMVAALLIKAIYMWLEARKYNKKSQETNETIADSPDESKSPKDSKSPESTNDDDDGTDDANDHDANDPDDDPDDTTSPDEITQSEAEERAERIKKLLESEIMESDQSAFSQLLPVFILSAVLGGVLYFSPSWFSATSRTFKLSVDDSLMFGLLAIFLASLSLASVLGKLSEEGSVIQWETLKSLALITLSLVLFLISLINISLAFFLAVATIPGALMVRPARSRTPSDPVWSDTLYPLLSNPSVIFMRIVTMVNKYADDPQVNPELDPIVPVAVLKPDGST